MEGEWTGRTGDTIEREEEGYREEEWPPTSFPVNDAFIARARNDDRVGRREGCRKGLRVEWMTGKRVGGREEENAEKDAGRVEEERI